MAKRTPKPAASAKGVDRTREQDQAAETPTGGERIHADLAIYDAVSMTTATRQQVAAWLRNEASAIENVEANAYAFTYTARCIS